MRERMITIRNIILHILFLIIVFAAAVGYNKMIQISESALISTVCTDIPWTWTYPTSGIVSHRWIQTGS